jgi:8-oxo-dGTP diphosphatase
MSEVAPRFGEVVAGAHYVHRPGSYALVHDDEGRIAVLETPKGLYLPGGGADPAETPEETLRRELREECGWEIAVIRELGRALEYVFAPGEGYFAKDCAFYEARITAEGAGGEEQVRWLPLEQAARDLKFASQRWALAQAR